ncbi:hypothetical protein SN15_03915 [Stenotrophomonas maltophilia]|nr:hypothetical protein SN15_03915 [Stenotrophomonas maltophilia]
MNAIARTNIRSLAVQRSKGTQLTTAERSNVSDFAKQLDDAVRDIAESVKESQRINANVAGLQAELSNRSFFGSVSSTFSGKTDKELATMLHGLGLSLHATQKIVQVILKVMTQKNRLLHDFHEVLVNKIALMATDSRTLDSSQKVVAREFMERLRDQVESQLHYYNRVDHLDMAVEEMELWRDDKDEKDAAVASGLEVLEEGVQEVVLRIGRSEAIASSLADQAESIQKLQSDDAVRIDKLDADGQVVAQQVAALKVRAEEAETNAATLLERLVALQNQVDGMATRVQGDAIRFEQQSKADAVRIEVLEAAQQKSRTLSSRLVAQLPAAVAGVVAAAALYLSLVP